MQIICRCSGAEADLEIGCMLHSMCREAMSSYDLSTEYHGPEYPKAQVG